MDVQDIDDERFDLDRVEFANFLAELKSTNKLRKLWEKYDEDRSGTLDPKELRKLLHSTIILYHRLIYPDVKDTEPRAYETNLLVRDMCDIIWQRLGSKNLVKENLDDIGPWLIEYYD
eukprot:UN32001